MKHPHTSDWADFARGLLDDRRSRALSTHALRCVSCRKTLDILSSVAALGRVEGQYTPAEDVTRRAVAAFVAPLTPSRPRPWTRLASVLIFDSWQTPALAGVRSSGSAAGSTRGGERRERHVTYRAGAWEVDVRVEPHAGHLHFVTGQLAHTSDEHARVDGSTVSILSGRRTIGRTTMNALGEFQLDCREWPERPQLTIAMTNSRTRLHIPLPSSSVARPARTSTPPKR